MPALDECHNEVVHALEKAGWRINKPFALTGEDGFVVYIDISAEKAQNGTTIYIEVKCFPGRNKSQELYIAFGQYIMYRGFLVKWKRSETLYLAIPIGIYESQFTETVRQTIEDNEIKLIIVDLEAEEVVQWKE